MPLEQSPMSAFVRPRHDYQRAKRAEKVQTDNLYGSKRLARKTSAGSELKERKKDEVNNNNENSNQANNSGIPKRSFTRTPESETSVRHKDVIRKNSTEKISPKPRRMLPVAPSGAGVKTRLAGNEVVSRRSTPDSSRRSTPERQFEKNRTTPEKFGQCEKGAMDSTPKGQQAAKSVTEGTRRTPETSQRNGDALQRTPEQLRKSDNSVLHKSSDISDRNSKIRKPVEGALTLPSKKVSESSEGSKPKGFLGGIKYNSLPRRHQSKNHSKFYLDIEGEEYMPKKKSEDSKLQDSEQNDKSTIEYGLEKLSLLAKGSKNFTNGLKFNSHEPPSLEIGSNDLKQTHVALFKFFPRHKDEILLEEGDPVNVSKISEDLWCDGTNLVSGKFGIFPSRYVADILAGPNSSSGINAEDQQFFLRFLGSVEVADYKGNEILCYAISKIVNQRAMLSSNTPPACTLQVSSRGIRVCDFDEKQMLKASPKAGKKMKGKEKEKEKAKDQCESQITPTHFFSLKNVTFCGNHPRDRRYFGFITKHPDEHRFACHVFMSKYSTDPVAQAVGDCFKKFYTQYLDYRAPTEDIYME